MKSIRDVLKNMSGGDYMAHAERAFADVLANPYVQQWMATQAPVDPDALRVHMHKLYQYARDCANCGQCPGLERCPNDFSGHFTVLQMTVGDEARANLTESKQMCDLLRAKQHEDNLRQRIRSFHIDERALSTGFSASDILALDIERAKAVQLVIKYILQTREQGLQTRGLFLTGPFGTGKTFLLCYMLHELAKVGYTGAIVYMPDFVEDVKSMITEPQRLKETMELLKTTDILVFDDLGAENVSPWVRDHVFGAILNERMGRKPTCFTSNFDLAGLQSHFSFTNKEGDEEHKGQRIMERIRHDVDCIYVGGTNKRERRKR